LVKACAGSKDPAIWQEFIRRFQPVIATAVLRTANRFSKPTRQTLDDLVQETYLKLCDDDCRLLRSFESRHPDAIFGFLKVVAGNVANDHFKSALAEKRGAGVTEAVPDTAALSPVTRAVSSSTSMDRRILLRQIDDALTVVAAGPDLERNRLIFWLYYRDGLSASAIASLPYIKLTTKGVESILLRLTRMIRSHMTKGTDSTMPSDSNEGFQRVKSL
jgi:DNA-directed RNA polymerase specialized sigma24 family protein